MYVRAWHNVKSFVYNSLLAHFSVATIASWMLDLLFSYGRLYCENIKQHQIFKLVHHS